MFKINWYLAAKMIIFGERPKPIFPNSSQS